MVARALREMDYSVEHVLAADRRRVKPLFSRKKKSKRTQPPAAPAAGSSTPSPVKRSQSMQLAPAKRQHAECRHTVEQVQQAVSYQKGHLNLVIVGHVDAGKSTLMGHLLTLCGRFSRSHLSRVAQEAGAAGKPEERFAWVMAEDRTEREHGVTIDVAMVEFETERLAVTVLDAPGHADFVPNMIAGASQADAALLVVDATNPLINKGQVREHLLLCRALLVPSLIVVVNKMDAVDYDEGVYNAVVEPLRAFL
jgi:GTPase